MRRSLLKGALTAALAALIPAAAHATTFTVTKPTDTNDHACTATNCSLRDAIIASNATLGSNTIKLRAGHYKLTIPGTNEHAAATGDLNIVNHVTIDGAGASSTTIDANHIDRVFETFGGASLTLSGVTVTGGVAVAPSPGAAVEGGAILVDGGGSLTTTNAAFTGNTAAGSTGSAGGFGGAIDVEPPSSNAAVSLTNTTLSANQAGGSAATDQGFGGAIDNQEAGTVTLDHVTMTGNHAGSHQAGGYGGGVTAEGSLVDRSSTFTGNTAGGGRTFGYGGALNVVTLTSIDSTFRGNDAGGGGGSGYGRGGAIYLGTSATLTRSVVTGNRAGGGGDGTGAGAFGRGGGIDGQGSLPVTLTDSTVSGNTAGGGDANSYGDGGGLNAAVTATGSTISGNKAGGGGGFGYGGGIEGFGAGALTNSTVSGNIAGGGGAGFGYGGGIDDVSGVTLTFSDVVQNSAVVEASTGGGGGVHGAVTSQDSIIANNTSTNGRNCAVPATSLGHNLESDTSCGFTAPGDVSGAVSLGPLQNNGGLTLTRALLAGSPAINHGNTTGCPATDQRGVSRPQGSACDIGAYEAAPPRAKTGPARLEPPGHVSLSGVALNFDLVVGTEFFQFGKSTAYGKQSKSLPLVDGPSERLFTVVIGKLAPGTRYHYRAVDRNPDGMSLGSDMTFRTPAAPKLSQLKFHPSKFMAGKHHGTTVSYTDSKVGETKFTILHNDKPLAGFTRDTRAGDNHFHFSGKAKGRKLAAGSYELRARARDSFGYASHTVTKHFKIKG